MVDRGAAPRRRAAGRGGECDAVQAAAAKNPGARGRLAGVGQRIGIPKCRGQRGQARLLEGGAKVLTGLHCGRPVRCGVRLALDERFHEFCRPDVPGGTSELDPVDRRARQP